MRKANQIIIASIFVFMLVDIGFKVSILDALEKKQSVAHASGKVLSKNTRQIATVKPKAPSKNVSATSKKTVLKKPAGKKAKRSEL